MQVMKEPPWWTGIELPGYKKPCDGYGESHARFIGLNRFVILQNKRPPTHEASEAKPGSCLPGARREENGHRIAASRIYQPLRESVKA